MNTVKEMVYYFLFEFAPNGQASLTQIVQSIISYGFKKEDIKEAIIELLKEDQIFFNSLTCEFSV